MGVFDTFCVRFHMWYLTFPEEIVINKGCECALCLYNLYFMCIYVLVIIEDRF